MAAQQTTPKDEPLTLQSPGSSRWSGFAGNEHECHTTLQLGNGEANGPRCSRGLRIRVTGSGLDSFEVTKIRVVPTGSVGDPAAPQWELAPERAADGVFADAPDVELVLPSSDPTSAVLPPGERLRRRAHTPVFAAMAADRAGVVVYVSGVLLREGKGAIEIHAETTAADGATLTTTSKNSLEVRAALRAPILPEWVDDARLRANRSVLAEYEAREVAVGWLGFDRAWPDVRGVIAQMLGQLSALLVEIARSEPKREQVVLGGRAPSSEILAALKRGADVIIRGRSDMRAMLDDTDGESICLSSIEGEPSSEDGFAADVLRKGGERLDFQAPVAVGDTDAAWTKILAELDRGAQVSLRAGRYGSAFRIEVAHQPEGSNYFPDPSQAERYARVQIGWSCPRPVRSASALLLTRVGSDLLACAGEIEGNLGGVLLAQGRMFDLATFTTTYESLVDTRMRAGDPKWLASHVRSPGHRVLVPAGAATKLVASPGVEQRMLAHAVLLSARGDDPFTAEREPMERAVLPLVGSREDIVT
jgi:hypothetical protein